MSSRNRYTSPLHASARFVAQRGLLKPLVWRLVTVNVLGEEHLKGLSRPFVVVSNHASHLDAPLILGSLPRKLASP
jgi:1-acyl-sn-glycerol-3-phosphate acyltransferase